MRIRIRFFLVVIAVAASMARHAIIGAVDVSCCREGESCPLSGISHRYTCSPLW